MKNKAMVGAVVIVAILAVAGYLYLPPMVQHSRIEGIIRRQFAENWKGVADGCGENSLTGITSIEKTPEGYTVGIDYLCGMVSPSTPPSHATVYIANDGSVTGVPALGR